jgi:hypothetical protein
MPTAKIDYAVERQGNVGGTYRRRLDDAFKALDRLKVEKLPPAVAFIFYFLACEKIAKVMVGIRQRKPSQGPRFDKINPRCSDIFKAAEFFGTAHISDDDINAIFVGDKINRFSAYALRNRLFHDFGPWHVKEAQEHAPKLIEAMQRFLKFRGPIIRRLEAEAHDTTRH